MLAIASDYLDRSAAQGLSADYELRFGPGHRYRLVVDGASVTVSSAGDARGRADCVITADPVAFLLVGYGRVGHWRPALRGTLRAGGRKPWLALRFSSLLVSP